MGVYLERARLLFRQTRYDLAEHELLRALANDPAAPLAHALLGLCRGRLQRCREAERDAREAVRLAPALAYVHYALGYVLDDGGHLEEAATHVLEAIRLDPVNVDAFALLSYVRARQRRYLDALSAAEAGLRLQPEHVHCLNRRALALAQVRRPEEAEAVIRSAVICGPSDAVTRAHFGWVLLEQQKPAPALTQLREALRLDPRLTWARDKMVDGLVQLIEQGLSGQAAEHFPDALRRDPEMEAGRQRLLRALVGRLPEALAVAVQGAWLLACYLALGPTLQPRLLPLLFGFLFLYAYACPRRFVLVEPIEHLLVRFRRLGRQVLAPPQVCRSNRVAACLAGVGAMGLWAGLVGGAFASLAAVLSLSLVLPAAWLGACPPGRPRRVMGDYFALLCGAATSLFALAVTGHADEAFVAGARDLHLLFGAGLTGMLGRVLVAASNS
jgi:tetratricopeptide (TPR) repeat protein